MSKEYSVGGGGITLANAVATLVSVHNAAAITPSLYFMRMWASQQGSATSAQQRIQVATQAAAFGSAFTGAVPKSLKRSDSVASLIVSGTAQAAGTCCIHAAGRSEGAGTITVMFDDNFNVLNGYLWVPTPREVIETPGSDASAVILYLPAAASSLGNWAFAMNFAEGA